MKKILVIDDDPEIVNLIKSRLEANHYEVTTAQDGEEGLKKVQHEMPNLIIVDVAMPKKDGYTFVLELGQQDDFKHIPVVVLTAKDKMRDLFNLEGFPNYMIKPFVAEELLQKLSELLQGEPPSLLESIS